MSVCADDRPAMEECAFIHVRSSYGWWLSVNNDGSGSYGFGTGLARANVKKNTFSFERVFKDVEKVFPEKPARGEEAYMAVSYWKANTSSATEYYIALKRQLLTKLFLTARNNIRPPENWAEKKSFDQVESFWRNNPWIGISPEEK